MTIQELYPVMREIRNNMKKIGIQCSDRITEIKFTGQRKTWGKCYKEGSTYRIMLSDRLGKLEKTHTAVQSVMAHELLHTCPNCWQHKGEFARLAKILEKEYGYKIEEHTKEGLDVPDSVYYDDPYIIQCKECHQKYYYNKKMRWFKLLDACGCGNCRKKGTLKFIKGGI